MHPSVSHVPPTRAWLYAVPLTTYSVPWLLSPRVREKRKKMNWKALGGIAGLGAGTFFTERAILHTVGGATRPLFGEPQTWKTHARFFAGHTLPLSVLATTGFLAARKLLNKKRKDDPDIRQARRLAIGGGLMGIGIGLTEKLQPWMTRTLAARKEARILQAAARIVGRGKVIKPYRRQFLVGPARAAAVAKLAHKLRERYRWRYIYPRLDWRITRVKVPLQLAAVPTAALLLHLRARRRAREQEHRG
jgi:hypothetical protein